MGASLAPFLESELSNEDVRLSRWVLAGAYSLAAHRAYVAFLHSKNLRSNARDRFMCLFAMALGPRQSAGAAAVVRAVEKSRSGLEQIAACFALARFADRAALPAALIEHAKDSGTLGAALYSGPAKRRSWIELRIRRWAHQDLVWRSWLLGGSGAARVDADRLGLALEVLRGRVGAPRVPGAAAWFLARAPDAAMQLSADEMWELPLGLRLLLCHSPALRKRILAHGSTPAPTDLPGLQRRWFALFARWAPLDAVRVALTKWENLAVLRDEDARRALAFAVASRLLSMSAAEAVAAKFDLAWLMSTDVAPWLQVALGRDTRTPRPRGERGELYRSLRLAVRGQLSRAGAAELMERELWRGGAHPGLCGLELHRQLQGEMLIDGSSIAATNFVGSMRKPYVAEGINRDDRVFRIANEFYKFIRAEEPWTMPEYRLAN